MKKGSFNSGKPVKGNSPRSSSNIDWKADKFLSETKKDSTKYSLKTKGV
jgi:hypothetical protein